MMSHQETDEWPLVQEVAIREDGVGLRQVTSYEGCDSREEMFARVLDKLDPFLLNLYHFIIG